MNVGASGRDEVNMHGPCHRLPMEEEGEGEESRAAAETREMRRTERRREGLGSVGWWCYDSPPVGTVSAEKG